MRRNVFLGHVLLWLAFSPVALSAATQYCASALAHQPQLGPPLTVISGLRVYAPWAWLLWSYHYETYAPQVFATANQIFYAIFFATFGLAFLLAVFRLKRAPSSNAHGSARWATTDELADAGLLGEEGVVLCQTNDAVYSSRSLDRGAAKWTLDRPGQLLRHDGPEHVFVFAPTRSGKGVGIVVPTLLAWRHSVLVYDVKKELWAMTAGWRRRFSHCWRFEPTAADSVRFNPLLEIRRGRHEVKDTQNVADILVDPTGDKETRDHWQTTAHRLLVGAILHVLYAEKEKSLAGVLRFLTDPSRPQFQTLDRMLRTHHLGAEPHPVVASAAREMMNKAEKELSGVFSSATACLGLYDDPIIAHNTSASDFRIEDLMNAGRPVSLYLVVPPSDLSRTRPIIRLLLNQMGRRLTESMELGETKRFKNRLLVLLDEFPSLGRLDFFETVLAFVAGYGLKCLLIAQSLNQLERAYGPRNSILDNCHVRVTYTANDDHTARRISDLLGQATELKRQHNFSGARLAPWLGHVSENEQEYGRALLTPGEVLHLPFDDALVMVGGIPPYRAKKVMHYQDDRFRERANLPRPDAPDEQAAELLQQPVSEWAGLIVEPIEPPKPASEAQPPAEPASTPEVPAEATAPADPTLPDGVAAFMESPSYESSGESESKERQ